MNHFKNIILCSIFLVLLAMLCFQTFAKVRYETKVLSFGDDEMSILSALTYDNGWQIVGSRRALNDKVGVYEFVFQRKAGYFFFSD